MSDDSNESAPASFAASDVSGRELRYISDTPELLGLLYDLDLLPEQLTFGTRDWGRMLQLTAWHRHTRSQRLTNWDGSAASLHRLVRPFLRENTSMWREREDIRLALEALKDGASEALLCLECTEPQRQPMQASAALAEMECEIQKLWARL